MRIVILFFLALIASVSIATVILVDTFDSTLLNKGYIVTKISENGLYETLIDSMNTGSDANFLGVKGFIEVIQMKPEVLEAEKSVVNGFVSSFVSYLRNPSTETIEFGLPNELFTDGTTVSAENLLPKNVLSGMPKVKGVVQFLFVLRNVCIVLAFGFLVLVLIIARGINSKVRWLGVSFLFSGLSVFLFSAVSSAVLSRWADAVLPAGNSAAVALSVLFNSMLSGFTFSLLVQGILLVALAVFFILIPVIFIKYNRTKNRKARTAKGKV